MPEALIAQSEGPLLNPLQRVLNTFVAPAKTFQDVKRSSGWWLPFLLAVVVGALYGYIVVHKVGLPTLVDGTIRQSPTLESRIASSTPQQAAALRTGIGRNMTYVFYAAPVLNIVVGLLAGGIFLASANFGAGGKATFGQMLAVWYYGTLPLVLFFLVVIAAIYGGATGDAFNMKNQIGTNPGFYLADSDLPKMLIPILSAIDIFAIWTAVVLTIGVSTVAGIKRGAAAAIVFGWWILFILLQTAGAMIGG